MTSDESPARGDGEEGTPRFAPRATYPTPMYDYQEPGQSHGHQRGHERAAAAQGGPPRRRRVLIASAALLVVAVVVVVAVAMTGSSGPSGTQTTAFSTDFPGTALDTATWAECYTWAKGSQGCTNFGNGKEEEWYLPSQVHVEDGMLALVAQRVPTQGTDKQGNPKTYSCRSGMVTTYPGFHFKYGTVQVVARLPFGNGLWPAIWLLPADGSWPPEIDIAEHWHFDSVVHATLHTTQKTQVKGILKFPDAGQGWHTYTLNWTQSRISIYYDGKLALTTTTGIPHQAMYLLMDLANDNNAPGSCTGTMYVKSVRIWGSS